MQNIVLTQFNFQSVATPNSIMYFYLNKPNAISNGFPI